jgi:choline monooxygenase
VQADAFSETVGLVPSPRPTPMLQPFEVYDQDLFDLEMVRVFARSWVWLGDTEDLQEPGDFITGRIG